MNTWHVSPSSHIFATASHLISFLALDSSVPWPQTTSASRGLSPVIRAHSPFQMVDWGANSPTRVW